MEDADSAGTDEKAHDDQEDAPQQLPAEQGENPRYHEDYRDYPQN